MQSRILSSATLLRMLNRKSLEFASMQRCCKSERPTFHHDHIDVDGADGRLGETLPLLQDPGYFAGWDPVVRFGPKCHQLPHCHTWGAEGTRWVSTHPEHSHTPTPSARLRPREVVCRSASLFQKDWDYTSHLHHSDHLYFQCCLWVLSFC